MRVVTNEGASPATRAEPKKIGLAVAGSVLLALGVMVVPWLRRMQLERDEHVALAELQCPAGMRPIPGGSFKLGDELDVTLPGFCLDAAEVTLADYGKCAAAGFCKTPEGTGAACNWNHPERARHPVNCVTAEDAEQYCAWAGKAVPSEAQWEFAARGGFRELAYPWGDQEPTADSACWSPRGERRGTCEVASFRATTFGLHDMAGNVGEWVAARAGGGAKAEPEQRLGGAARSLTHCSRGGSWMVGDPMLLHSVICIEREHSEHGPNLGVRCATAAARPVEAAARRANPAPYPH